MLPRFRGTCLVLVAALAAPGCRIASVTAGIDEAEAKPTVGAFGGTAGRPVARTLPVEVFFVRCPEEALSRLDELWSRVDEQIIGDDVRRRLAANGMRAGVLMGELPTAILADAEPPVAAEEDVPADVANTADASPPVVRRVLRLLPGRESEVVSLKSLPELVVMEHDDDGLRGTSYTDALPHFSLRARPAADGRLRIDLVPVIRHGPIERTWVGEDGAFKVETGQRKVVMEALRWQATVPAEGMLLVGPAGDGGATVGDALFRPRGSGRREVRLLAMRPLTPGIDPMFAPAGAEDHAERPSNDTGRP